MSFLMIDVDDANFFQSDWAGACWGRWAGLGWLWTSLEALDRQARGRNAVGLACRHWRCALLSSARTRKKKSRRGLRPWPLRCLSQFLFERKVRMLRGRMCCVPFTDGVAWYL